MSNLQISIKFIPKKVFCENLNPQPIFYPKAKIKEADSNLIFDTASCSNFIEKFIYLLSMYYYYDLYPVIRRLDPKQQS